MAIFTRAPGQYLKASSYYLTGTLGGAYAFTDALSASFGLRYISAVNKTKMGLTLTDSPLGYPDQPLALRQPGQGRRPGIRAGGAFRRHSQAGPVRPL